MNSEEYVFHLLAAAILNIVFLILLCCTPLHAPLSYSLMRACKHQVTLMYSLWMTDRPVQYLFTQLLLYMGGVGVPHCYLAKNGGADITAALKSHVP